ncbi:hypothetical protein PAXRUDRAFT_66134, partial [Paxillus rubicundulus Ve08.2h10]
IVGTLQHLAPHIFTQTATDGSMFKCSEMWVHTFLYDHLNYVMHKGTCAAQKLPPNLDEVCCEHFLCLTSILHDNVITLGDLHVNINQTNIVYQPGNGQTYKVIGSKQVAIVGQEEKCACTLLIGISAGGCLLPWQIV